MVTAVLDWTAMVFDDDARLRSLEEQGYRYTLLGPQPTGALEVVAATEPPAPPPPRSAAAVAHVPGADWTLYVSPARGFVPAWRTPLLAMTTVAGALIGLLVGAVLVGRRQQNALLVRTRAACSALAEEKRRMDLLLERQHDLISCVLAGEYDGGADGGGAGPGGAGGGAKRGMRSAQEKALERIEDMRRAIGAAPPGPAADELQLQELLGEGSL